MIDKKQAKQKGLNIIDSTQESNPLKSMLEQNFPDTLSEGQVNLKAIAMLLGLDSSANTQGYELTFTGKALANTLYTTPTEYELREETKRSKKRESTENSIIIGDNLDVLKILKSAYYEKIKMIYIDPPYNTKNENFIYPDDFRKDYKTILKEVGLLETDEEGNEIESKTLQTFRSITRSRSHSGWLSFMLPRLKLARDLLREDGVIFISIDDNEQANLKILCDEIFGEENFVVEMIWLKGKELEANNIGYHHEKILLYSKDSSNLSIKLRPKDLSRHTTELKEENLVDGIQAIYKDGELFQLINLSKQSDYDLSIPLKNGEIIQTKGYLKPDTLQQYIERGQIFVGKNKTPYVKSFASDERDGSVTSSIIDSDIGTTKKGGLQLKNLFNKQKIFDYPKPSSLIHYLLEMIEIDNDNSIILDFFAGSGTTAQAVMELNAEDGGNRKFILVQLDEEIKLDKKIKKDKNKSAYDFVKNELGRDKPTISDITIERVNRAGEKLKNEKDSDLDIGYRVYSLNEKARLSDEGNIIPHNAHITPQDIARNLALFAGKPLHLPLKEIVEDKLFMCEDILCVVEIDKEVEKRILEDKNKAIFIDGYGTHTLESFLNLNIPNDERVNIIY